MTHKDIGGALFFLMLFLSCNLGFGQNGFLKGKLVDAKTGEPIVFATIVLENKALGVITNIEGDFKLPIEFKSQGDTLRISSLGYESKSVPLQNFAAQVVNKITLDPTLEVLHEVVVKGERSSGVEIKRELLSGQEIVELAIRRITDNYPKIPFSLVGYYRDYQLKDSIYLNLNESLMEVFDSGFLTNDYDVTKTSIYDYKRNSDFPRDTITEKPYDYENENKTIAGASLDGFGGNEFMILRIHDPIRNHRINSFDYINVFDVDFVDNHEFKRDADILFGDEKLFVVNIDRRDEGHAVLGKLFVSQDNFAIHKMEYALFRGGSRVAVNELYNRTKRARDKFFEIQVEYRPIDDVMYLNYISVSNSFRVKQDPVFKVDSMFMNWDDFCYEVHFSKSPMVSDAIKPNKYHLRFKGKKVRIERVEVRKKRVRLFCQLDGVKINLGDGNWRIGIDRPDEFSLRIRNLRDVDGNRIDKGDWSRVVQFREFFVQRAKPKNPAPMNYPYMRKNVPIFERQPIFRPDNFDDYWMNTPLMKIKE